MAAPSANKTTGEDAANKLEAELSKSLKEGERILAPTRRPDGTLRKPIRIRAGYVPQDEVAIYKSKGALWKKEMEAAQEVPPGYDPDSSVKPKSKSVKRNERKKEKRLQQAAADKGKNLDLEADEECESENKPSTKQELESIESVASQMNDLTISANSSESALKNSNLPESVNSGNHVPDIDKRIRALKKKIRLAEGQLQNISPEEMKPEQLDKMKKLETWHDELKLLENRKEHIGAS